MICCCFIHRIALFPLLLLDSVTSAILRGWGWWGWRHTSCCHPATLPSGHAHTSRCVPPPHTPKKKTGGPPAGFPNPGTNTDKLKLSSSQISISLSFTHTHALMRDVCFALTSKMCKSLASMTNTMLLVSERNVLFFLQLKQKMFWALI